MKSTLLPAVLVSCITAFTGAQEVTVSLTHDSSVPASTLRPVRFTFSIDFPESYEVAETIVARLVPSAPPMLRASPIYFPEFSIPSNQTSDEAGGFEYLSFTNSLFYEAYDGWPAIRSNPLEFGSFEIFSLCPGTLSYQLLPGHVSAYASFVTLGINFFTAVSVPYDGVDITIPPLDIAPDTRPLFSSRFNTSTIPGGGSNGGVRCMIETRDGELVVGGTFTEIGGVPANRLARLEGENWTPINQFSMFAIDFIEEAPNGDLILAWNISGLPGRVVLARIDPITGTELDKAVMFGRANDLVVTQDGVVWIMGNKLIPQILENNPGGYNSIWRWDEGQEIVKADLLTQREIKDGLVLPSGELVITGDTTEPRSSEMVPSTHRYNGTAWEPIGYGDSVELFLAPDGSLLQQDDRNRLWRFQDEVWSQIHSEFFHFSRDVLVTLPDGSYLVRLVSTFFDGLALFRNDEPVSFQVGPAMEIDGDILDAIVLSSGQIVLAGDFQSAAGRPAGGLTVFEITDTSPCCLSVDLNADAVITIDDVYSMVNRFIAGDLAADLNKDSILDHGDLHEFVTRYLNGCAD